MQLNRSGLTRPNFLTLPWFQPRDSCELDLHQSYQQKRKQQGDKMSNCECTYCALNNPTANGTCDHCHKNYCEDCLYQCDKCEGIFCCDHCHLCDKCDNIVCDKCAERCNICGNTFCKDCLNSCDKCGAYCCDNDAASCEGCDCLWNGED